MQAQDGTGSKRSTCTPLGASSEGNQSRVAAHKLHPATSGSREKQQFVLSIAKRFRLEEILTNDRRVISPVEPLLRAQQIRNFLFPSKLKRRKI